MLIYKEIKKNFRKISKKRNYFLKEITRFFGEIRGPCCIYHVFLVRKKGEHFGASYLIYIKEINVFVLIK